MDLFALNLNPGLQQANRGVNQAPRPRAAAASSPPAVWPVIATKGRPEWLVKQLERLCPQLVEAERIVVVVDGDDRTVQAIENLSAVMDGQSADPVAVIPLARSVGPDRAKRIGIAMVPADGVVCEIDDHDLAEQGLLAELRQVFANPDVLVAGCDVYHSDPEGLVRKLRRKKAGPFRENGNSLGWGMRAYRKWAYDCVGGYPQEWFPANDYALMCMLEQFGGKGAVAHIREPLVTVIEDMQGISNQNKELQRGQVVRVANLGLARSFELPFGLLRSAGGPTPEEAQTLGQSRRRRVIPKLLHFVWIGPPMPDWAERNIERFKELNPGFRCLTHGEEVLMEAFRPGYDAIAGEHVYGRKSDLLRVSVLAKYGGWYFDSDFCPLRPLSDVYDRYDDFPAGCFLIRSSEILVANGVIGCALNNVFFEELVAELTKLASEPKERAWDAFGPRAYTTVADRRAADVRVGSSEMFMPFTDVEGEAQAKYLELAKADFSEDAIAEMFADRAELPYMFHMHMQDRLELHA